MSLTNTQRIKGVWEKEFSATTDEETWEDIWKYAQKISICTPTKGSLFIRLYIKFIIADIPLTPHFLLCVSSVNLK